MTYEYEMIDSFLRNNLNDDDYEEYSAALDELVKPQSECLLNKVSVNPEDN